MPKYNSTEFYWLSKVNSLFKALVRFTVVIHTLVIYTFPYMQHVFTLEMPLVFNQMLSDTFGNSCSKFSLMTIQQHAAF